MAHISDNDRGQLIIMGIPGPELTDGLRSLIATIQPGGFILFNRNIESPNQLFNLTKELYGLCEHHPVMTIDQEGGRVARLTAIGERPVSGQALAQTGDLELSKEHGVLTGRLLKAFGFNLNLAPVADYSIDEMADNSLRGRCFGSSAEQVIHLAGAFLEGQESEGVLATIKHFPGYTHCPLDPHGNLPKITRKREEMEAEELVAFRHFIDKASCYMVGHGHFTAWHEEPYPASLSPQIIQELLIHEMNYQGVVMTDDLEMGAIGERYPAAEVTRLALEAGEHFLLFCHNPACAEISRRTLQTLPEDLVLPKLERVMAFKQKLVGIPDLLDLNALEEINQQTAHLRDKVESLILKK
ncbi:MAG: glycoside hydrolase family 3 N-terminal domain-containing protein [Verrucomicrobiota bacterium]